MKVTIERDDRLIRGCEVHLKENQRLSDVLNDDRGFLPIITREGKFSLIRKSTIISVTEEASYPSAE